MHFSYFLIIFCFARLLSSATSHRDVLVKSIRRSAAPLVMIFSAFCLPRLAGCRWLTQLLPVWSMTTSEWEAGARRQRVGARCRRSDIKQSKKAGENRNKKNAEMWRAAHTREHAAEYIISHNQLISQFGFSLTARKTMFCR